MGSFSFNSVFPFVSCIEYKYSPQENEGWMERKRGKKGGKDEGSKSTRRGGGR